MSTVHMREWRANLRQALSSSLGVVTYRCAKPEIADSKLIQTMAIKLIASSYSEGLIDFGPHLQWCNGGLWRPRTTALTPSKIYFIQVVTPEIFVVTSAMCY